MKVLTEGYDNDKTEQCIMLDKMPNEAVHLFNEQRISTLCAGMTCACVLFVFKTRRIRK